MDILIYHSLKIRLGEVYPDGAVVQPASCME